MVEREGDINMLPDLSAFQWDKVSARGADMRFSHTYRKQTTKMAIVGDNKLAKWLTHLVDPFYAREAKYFHSNEGDAAWHWLHD